ncbi:MAG: hypothetical protein U0793_08395 [Gemmataceae bacterium]
MIRRLLLPACVLAVAGLGWAAGDAPRLEDERLAEFRRDLDLIESFVDEALSLAEQDDPLQRAQTCNALADRLGQQVKRASSDPKTKRLAALGEMMQAVLVRGVADNLERAREDKPSYKDFVRVGGKINEMTGAMERLLKKTFDGLEDKASRDSMAPALEALKKGRREVESVLSGKKRHIETHGKGREKGKGKGKF